MSASTTPPAPLLKRPGGARPLPSKIIPPSKLSIPDGNVPGINVDQANENGWQQPPSSLPPLSGTPSLALNPMGRSSAASSSRPKLSLSGFSSPAPGSSPSLLPSASSAPPSESLPPMFLGRPSLLHGPSSSGTPGRRSGASTPSLKLAIPSLSLGSASSGYSASHEYPSDPPGYTADEEYNLNTPTAGSFSAGVEDRNPTLVPRGKGDWEGDEESSYGYGRLNNGLGSNNGDAMSSMTADIRQALSRSRFDSYTSASAGSAGAGGSSHAGNGNGYGYGDRSSERMSRDGSRTSSRSSSVHRGAGGSIGRDGGGGGGGIPDFSGLSLEEKRRSIDSERSSGRSTPVALYREDGHGHGQGPSSPVLEPEKLIVVRRLGEGSGGAVELVKDPRSGRLMAKKVIARTANPTMHRQLLRELEILNSCDSPYIVQHYASFLADHDSQIGILMEYCEGGSLDGLLGKMKQTGMRCSEHVLGRIASSVLRGLDYLHERRIIHRDIKPANILVTKSGQCKLADFGVSGELVDSVAGTFTGTSYYMAPERIQGKPYSIRADVWSLGLTLHEIAHLRFPFPPEGENEYVAPIELLSYIVTAPVPVMVDDESIGRVWSEGIKNFMGLCLIRSGTDRPYPRELQQHPFILTSEAKKVNMSKWVAALLES